jgi:hypothetical protein
VDIHVHFSNGYVTKESIDAIISKIRWMTYPEGKEVVFSSSWIQPKPYEDPKDTPKGQPLGQIPTDITGNPVGTPSSSEQKTTISITAKEKISDGWYQIVFDDQDSKSKNIDVINPRKNGKIISRFSSSSQPTIQSVQICKKTEDTQKVSIRFSEPVDYKSLEAGLGVISLGPGSACVFIAQKNSHQTEIADYLCKKSWSETVAIELKINEQLKSSSTHKPIQLMNNEAKNQEDMLSYVTSKEINFKTSYYNESEFCYTWKP